MSIQKQTDSRTNITYVYETSYRWDKQKQQSRATRKCIGKIDPLTGNIVPTRGRKPNGEGVKHKSKTKSAEQTSFEISENVHLKRSFYGATYLLESFSNELGLTKDLQRCFPERYKQLLSIAFYLILEDNNPLYRFERWHLTHKHPYDQNISSAESSKLFASIKESQIYQFFALQAKRRTENEYWAYDSTSISSYSETLTQVQYGKNKEDDKLPQLNLLLVFGEKSHLPFYYRKLAGNIPDVKTVKHLLAEFDILNINKAKLIMDRGFYSQENINTLYREHRKFLIAPKMSLAFIKANLDPIYDDLRMFTNFDEESNTYGRCVSAEWDYSQTRIYKKDTIKAKRRMYIHYYYNLDKGAEEESAFDKRIAGLYKELKEGKQVEAHQKAYKQFFDVNVTPKRGISISYKEDAIREARKYIGYFSLISNEKMTSMEALRLYRRKDVVEKAFGNLKERLNMRRMLVSSERSLEGKLFAEFIALILVSHLDNKMRTSQLYSKYSMPLLFDKLNIIECFEYESNRLKVGELLDKQIEIYKDLGLAPPSSSC